LGYRKLNAAKATNEPSGTLYDGIFASRVHKCHEMGRRVNNSQAMATKKTLRDQNQIRKDTYEHTAKRTGSLLENQTAIREDLKKRNSLNEKSSMANYLKN